MKEAIINEKHKVIFYDNIRTLPLRRYQRFNKFIMIACEVGDSIGDYDSRMSRAFGYLQREDCKSAAIELTNQRQCLHNALENYSPSGMALACLVQSINGVVFSDFEDETLNVVLDTLDKIGFTKENEHSIIDEIKKKLRKI